ncbi:MAG: hypothetical protein ACJAS9_002519 [Polaribacter sp.]|jgi:hypothetical protein
MNKTIESGIKNVELTTKSLIKNSLVAIVIAITIFYTVIYPIEFGQDPLGTGKILGLPVLQAATKVETEPMNKSMYEFQKDSVDIIIPAKSGLEYKFKLTQFSNLTYKWTSEIPLYFDFHGEPKGDTTGYFESYTIATSNKMEGSMTVPFEGVHGWYWKNTSDEEVLVTLNTQGNYEVVGFVH